MSNNNPTIFPDRWNHRTATAATLFQIPVPSRCYAVIPLCQNRHSYLLQTHKDNQFVTHQETNQGLKFSW